MFSLVCHLGKSAKLIPAKQYNEHIKDATFNRLETLTNNALEQWNNAHNQQKTMEQAPPLLCAEHLTHLKKSRGFFAARPRDVSQVNYYVRTYVQ